MKNTTNTDNQTILLSNGCFVHPDLLNWVRDVVTLRIPELSPHTAYTLKQICGEYFWDKLSKLNKLDAGYCMVHLVKRGEVPFRVVKGRHEYPKLYQLTSTQLGTCVP